MTTDAFNEIRTLRATLGDALRLIDLLFAEIERLRAIEAAALTFAKIDATYGTTEETRWDAFDALCTALEKGGAK